MDLTTQEVNHNDFFFIEFLEREKKGEREREGGASIVFHLFMHSLIASCMCLNQGWNLQSLCMRTML